MKRLLTLDATRLMSHNINCSKRCGSACGGIWSTTRTVEKPTWFGIFTHLRHHNYGTL